MANPSLKNGFLKIATELVEQFGKTSISGSEWRILWVIWRKTWGWVDTENKDRKKDWDQIALSQFEKETGMKHSNVFQAVKSLVVKRLLMRSEKGFRFNQDYTQWIVDKRKPPVVKRLPKKVVKTLPNPVVKPLHTIDKRKKEINTGKKLAKPAEDWKVYISPMDMQKIIDLFEPLNPIYLSFFKDKTQRRHIHLIVDTLGLQKTIGLIEALPKIVEKPYAPKITTPFQLYKDLGKLILFFKQEKAREEGKGKGITNINNITTPENVE